MRTIQDVLDQYEPRKDNEEKERRIVESFRASLTRKQLYGEQRYEDK